MNDPSLKHRTILHLEDSAVDSKIIQNRIKHTHPDWTFYTVQSREEFLRELETKNIDLILADKSLPGFDGLSAWQITKEMRPSVPFVFVTGSIGEEAAIETMKVGATDYVLKGRLSRLLPAVERALREAEERRKAMDAEERIRKQAMFLDNAHDAILVCRLDTTITYLNKGAHALYGWTDGEAIGQLATGLMFRGDAESFEHARKHALENGAWTGEMVQLAKSGQKAIVKSSWTLIGQRAEPTFLIINTDISEQKALEEKFLRAQRMESIGILAGGIAHDLNNALAPILMVAQLLRMQNPAPQALELLDTLEKSAVHGAELIKQILSFARGVQGEYRDVQLSHLIREMQRLIKETFPRSINVRIGAPKDLWTIRGVPTHLNQVLMNLCVNARDAMPNGGTLTICAENALVDKEYKRFHPEAQCGAFVVLKVIDTGTGIPPEVMDRIYDPFFTTKEIGKGTGLGLSTVKGIVKSHAGFMHVYSEPGKGSIFKIYFPACAGQASSDSSTEEQKLPRGNGERILVVDDEAEVLHVTQLILEKHGYKVLMAENGAEGVALFAKEHGRIDLVLTDSMMPVMDGLAMIREIRSIQPAIKIIMLSGMIENHRTAEAVHNGQILFVEKPFSSAKLLTAVHRAIGHPIQ
jgi:two-component system, cell cycle sensor histidine kinase and response regulator CckA